MDDSTMQNLTICNRYYVGTLTCWSLILVCKCMLVMLCNLGPFLSLLNVVSELLSSFLTHWQCRYTNLGILGYFHPSSLVGQSSIQHHYKFVLFGFGDVFVFVVSPGASSCWIGSLSSRYYLLPIAMVIDSTRRSSAKLCLFCCCKSRELSLAIVNIAFSFLK